MSENRNPILDKSERNIANYVPVTKEEGFFIENVGALHLLYFYFNGTHKNNELGILDNIGSLKDDLEKIMVNPDISEIAIKQHLFSNEFKQRISNIDKLLPYYLSTIDNMLFDHKEHISKHGTTLYITNFFKEVNYVTKHLDNFRNVIMGMLNETVDGNNINYAPRQLESIFIRIETIIGSDNFVYTAEELEIS